jgi:DeoR/GlpR family transcriptional regulator of sugar metabolism
MDDATSQDPERSGRRLPAGRKAEIAAFVTEVGQASVVDVARRFDVSSDTARRDLDHLASEGLIVRTRGGATTRAVPPPPDSELDVRIRHSAAEKETVAALASTLVEDGDVIVINGGSTALALTRRLAGRRDLTIATNNLRLPAELHAGTYREVFLFGGTVRSVTQATSGPTSLLAPDGTEVQINCRTAFMGVGALTAHGYYTSNVGDAAMIRSMMGIAERVVVMADSSKFDTRLFAQISELGAADLFVTDTAPPPELAAAFERQGVEVLLPQRR